MVAVDTAGFKYLNTYKPITITVIKHFSCDAFKSKESNDKIQLADVKLYLLQAVTMLM